MAARSTSRRPSRTDDARTDTPTAPAEEPPATRIPLRGSPRSLTARVSLANTGSQRLLLRSGTLHVAGHDPIAFPLAVALRPGTTTVAPLHIDLGPSWPPGEVTGDGELGEARMPVSLVVEPAIALHLSPPEVLGVEGRWTVELTVTNEGNVAIPLAKHTRGRLVAHDSGPAAVAPVAPTGAGRVTVAPRETDPDLGLQAECHLAKPVTLEPGDSRRLTFEVEIPVGLDPTRRHRAAVPIGPADLTVTVLPTDSRPD